jgi:hypothetical protein
MLIRIPRESALSERSRHRHALLRRGRHAVLPALAAAALSLAAVTVAAPATAVPPSAAQDLGANVLIFDPSMPTAQIQAAVDAVAAQQVDNEMGSARYALLFKPGTYGSVAEPLTFQVGYYTEVAGLGLSPSDVTINGHVDVYNRCLTANNCIALDNFWRSMSNLTINVTGLSGCRASGDFWAVSQASPLRRVNITGGNLTLMDYCTAGPQFASGGYIADSQTGFVINGSQQQFFVRNSSLGGWSNGVWNQVFSGVTGAPAQSFSTTPGDPPYTTLDTTAVSREKPYLYVDAAGAYRVFVPSLAHDSSGTTWSGGATPGASLPLSSFYVAKPTDSADRLNDALESGRSLLLTPGVYHLRQALEVTHRNTVVLGLGLATLVPDRGNSAVEVGDVAGVRLAGFMVDAGAVNSRVLVRIGERGHVAGSATNPTSVQDVFIRIGGAASGKATTSLVVNSDNVILDDIWAWRADHGNGVGWTINTADTGLVVNGDNVSAYGLFVEHYQKYDVVWNGENGRTVFFQNEMPYDAPNQASWSHDGVLGYAAYKISPKVKHHQAWGLGSYCFFNVDPTIHATRAFEVPVTPGVVLHDLLTVSLGGVGVIDHVVNDTGDAAQGVNTVPVNVVRFPV